MRVQGNYTRARELLSGWKKRPFNEQLLEDLKAGRETFLLYREEDLAKDMDKAIAHVQETVDMINELVQLVEVGLKGVSRRKILVPGHLAPFSLVIMQKYNRCWEVRQESKGGETFLIFTRRRKQ